LINRKFRVHLGLTFIVVMYQIDENKEKKAALRDKIKREDAQEIQTVFYTFYVLGIVIRSPH
jgi:hypothetical protein